MLRIAVCDDLRAFLRHTKIAIQQWEKGPDELHIETFEDADSLLTAHRSKPFDIILLDVVMPLLDGIEAAREIRQNDRSVKIVFLTSSPEFAVASYTVKADNYLLKPVDKQALYRCLEQLYEDIRQRAKYIMVRSSTAMHRILLENIESVEAQNKRVLISLTDGSVIEAAEPLYAFENKLPLEEGFFKCHRSYMINLYRIDTYTQKEIHMRSGCRIPVSRSFHKEFETAYFTLLFGKTGEP